MQSPGYLFIFEGPDGAGKSTLAEALHSRLKERGVQCEAFSFPGKDVGTLGGLVNRLHHNSAAYGIPSINPVSVQVLHIAAHVDAIVGRIKPTLQSGTIVILDRFWWSTWVYGKASGVSDAALTGMLDVEFDAWGDIMPTVAFLIEGIAPKRTGEPIDKWNTRAELYRELASHEAQRYPVEYISNEGNIEKSLEQVWDVVQNFVTTKD
jgi:thymidylate kinase